MFSDVPHFVVVFNDGTVCNKKNFFFIINFINHLTNNNYLTM